MRALHLALVAALAVPGIAAAVPAAAQQAERTYTTYEQAGLTWVRGPSVRDMNRFYRLTRHDGGRGLARVWCISDAQGALDCDVIDEDPTDREYGLAGVRVMERATVASADGGSPEGRGFAFTLRFGNWPSSVLPDNFQPVSQNLLWVERPTLIGSWNMQGQERGERLSATVDCVAQGNGHLTCTLLSADTPEFGQAALNSMEEARVQRADSGALAGSPLRWTLAVERQSGCRTGGSGRSGQYPSMTTGIVSAQSLAAQAGAASTGGAAGPSYDYGPIQGEQPSETNGGMPGCQAAMVQVSAN